MTIYQAAKFYVDELGLSVIPIINGEKRPAIPWTRYQQHKPDSGELVEWFHQTNFQIGIVCGAASGGLTVLDFETPRAYQEWAGRHPRLARETRTVETGKGMHVYFLLPPDEVKGNQKLIPNLIETRGEGGQVLAPPSLHPSGRRYTLKGNARTIARTTWAEISEGEQWGKRGTARIDKRAAIETVAFGAKNGARNDSIFNAAVIMRDTGAPEAQALAVLYAANKNNDPPLDREEIKRTVNSAYSRPSQNQQREGAIPLNAIMDRIKVMREKQAKAWLAQANDPRQPDPDFVNQCRALMKDSGALDEIQIQEVVDEIMRNPSLAPRKQTELLRLWRVAHKRVRDAISGKATDDEIAAAFKAEYYQQRMYTRDRWYQWAESGVWTDRADVIDEIWAMMCEFKSVDVKPSSHKRRSIEECLSGKSYLGINECMVDAQPDWLNLLNGVYDVGTQELAKHNPEQYLTTQLPFDYDTDARCPRWSSFLSEVLVTQTGEPDIDMCAFLRQAFGYSLTAWTKFELSFWLQGGGANGKSTLIHILSALTGTSSMALNLGMLERDQYQLALLPGIRVVTCTESPVGLKVADSMIKSLVSGDILSVRLPYGKPFQLKPECKIWWAMNNYPRVADTSEGFWRKIKVVPFRASFDGKNRDTNLREKLLNELPGILNWALEGLHLLVRDGWHRCEAIDEATDVYRRSNDVEQVFIDYRCVVGETYTVMAEQLYNTYKQWCFDTGHRHKTMTRVATDWLRLGFQKKRGAKGVFYEGVGLKHSV